MIQQTLPVKGMHCASCSAIISKKLKKLPGIVNCDVNFATEKANISFEPEKVSVAQMNNEINKLGYSLLSPPNTNHETNSSIPSNHNGQIKGVDHSEHTPGMNHENHADADHSLHTAPMNHTNVIPVMDHSEHTGINQSKEEKLKELALLQSKVEFSLPVALTIFLLMMWDIFAKIFPFVPNLPIPMQLFNTLSFLLATVFMFWIGKPYLEAVARFIRYHVANMDSLVGIGTLTAYIYSSIVFLLPPVRGLLQVPEYTYFDVTIVVIGFITLGKYLETRSKLRTGEAIEKLLNLQAKTALIIRDGIETEVPVAEVRVGDVVIVKPGGKIPVDGTILEGSTAVDESMVSGEPLPVDKKKGDLVIGSTINKQGSIRYKATKVGADTILAQIIRLVEQAQGSRAQIQNLADRVSEVFIPAVLIIAVFTLIIWLTAGAYIYGMDTALSYGLLAFVGILVIACPCALGLATPTAIIVGVGKGAEHGILIKSADSLEKLHTVDTVVLDKTGTITNGKPTVTNVVTIEPSFSEKKLLQYTATIENHSQHPLAFAITEYAKQKDIQLLKTDAFRETEGVGVEGKIGKTHVVIRKPIPAENEMREIAPLQSQGKTVIVVEVSGKTVGAIAISDTLKKQAKQAIERLHELGLETVMLTGDNRKAAAFIAKQVGIRTVKAEVLPKDKAEVVKQLQNEGKKVAMAGDGINDAPALVAADVGVAMATGSDIAIESADITLLGGDIMKIAQAVRLSHMTIRTIKQNLFWAFIYNVIGIPLAAGAFYPLFGIFLNPIFAGLAMGLSSVSVVTNSLLLKKLRL